MQKDPAFDLAEMDFKKWSDLAKNDPESFEAMRQAAIEEVIQGAPASQQSRLRGLQWRIDQERRRAANPLAACMRISSMMWNALVGSGGLLENMRELTLDSDAPIQPKRQQAKGKILEFCRSGE
jgi:hypothetical protein